MQLDSYDMKMLNALQGDARLSNHELAKSVNLSASQCSRRRVRLENSGMISQYRAQLNRAKLGYSLEVFINVTLSTHNRESAQQFNRHVARIPNVMEAHTLTGEMDYIIKLVAKDLKELSDLIHEELLSFQCVQTVKSSIVLDTIRQDNSLPL